MACSVEAKSLCTNMSGSPLEAVNKASILSNAPVADSGSIGDVSPSKLVFF